MALALDVAAQLDALCDAVGASAPARAECEAACDACDRLRALLQARLASTSADGPGAAAAGGGGGMDLRRYGSRNVALRVAYDGSRYRGCAWQAHTDETVEAALFACLLRARLVASRSACCFSRAGRTDAGVSAAAQVFGLRLRCRATRGLGVIPAAEEGAEEADAAAAAAAAAAEEEEEEEEEDEIDYVGTLNRLLPPDIRVTGWAAVPREFDARRDAVSRTYRCTAHEPLTPSPQAQPQPASTPPIP